MSDHGFAIRSTASTSPSLADVVVCEQSQRYAVAARLTLGSTARIAETRNFDDAWQRLLAAPHGILLLEVDPQRAPQVISLLARLQTELPRVLVVACLVKATPAWELLLREAGAAIVVRVPWRLPVFGPWLRRHLALAPPPKSTLHEQIWSRLPWSAAEAPDTDGHTNELLPGS